MKIRITGKGIYGLPATGENPLGEYPTGHEIDLGGNDAPVGWVGRYEVVGGKSAKDAEFVANPGDAAERGTESKDEADKPRRGRPSAN